MANPKIQKQRAHVAALNTKRSGIVGAPRSQQERLGKLGQVVRGMAEDGQVKLDILAAHFDSPARARSEFLGLKVRNDSVDIGPLFAALLGPEAIMSALKRYTDQWPEGLTDKQRAARLAEVEAELFQAEVEEERLIVEAETATGEFIPRRRDADPRAILWTPGS